MEWIASSIIVFGAILLWAAMSGLRDRLERAERKLNMLLRHFNLDPAQGLPLSERVKEIARDRARKIEAIKVYRDETGAGLAEAKQAVEAYMNSL